MTTLLFIRHANSIGNHQRLCSGQYDFPLSELGKKQAEQAAKYLLSNYSINAIYASDLSRACQTAEPVAKALGLPIQTDPRLREVSAGVWECRAWDDIFAEDPEGFTRWFAHQFRKEDPRPVGAECYEEVAERMRDVVSQIVSENAGKCVAVFTHAKFMYVMLEEWSARSSEVAAFLTTHNGFSSSSITVVEYDENGDFFRFVKGNESCFLKKDQSLFVME